VRLGEADGGGEIGLLLMVAMLIRPQRLLKGEMEAERCVGSTYIARRRFQERKRRIWTRIWSVAMKESDAGDDLRKGALLTHGPRC
jgi:hypothetical protein